MAASRPEPARPELTKLTQPVNQQTGLPFESPRNAPILFEATGCYPSTARTKQARNPANPARRNIVLNPAQPGPNATQEHVFCGQADPLLQSALPEPTRTNMLVLPKQPDEIF